MKELINNIIDWGNSTGILESGTVEGQSLKTIEEMSELVKGVLKNDIDLIKDSVGDILVTQVLGNALDQKFDLNSIIEDQKDKDSPQPKSDLTDHEQVYNFIKWVSQLWEYPEDIYKGISLNSTINLLLTVTKSYDTTLEECLNLAYEEIKSRQGKMINGQFVKSEDLKNFEGE